MKKPRIPVACLIAAAGVLAAGGVAQANSIEIGGVTTTQNAGVWDYAYAMTLTANNSLSASNSNGSSMFVFYDLTGLQSASFVAGTTPSNAWNVITENTTGTWSGGLSTITSQGGTAVENDSASLPNVRFQYVGTGYSAGSTNAAIGTANLFSTQAPGLYGQFAARWVDPNGNTQVNTQSPLEPVSGSGTPPPAVPLPSAMWMGLSSLAALAVMARLRRVALRRA